MKFSIFSLSRGLILTLMAVFSMFGAMTAQASDNPASMFYESQAYSVDSNNLMIAYADKLSGDANQSSTVVLTNYLSYSDFGGDLFETPLSMYGSWSVIARSSPPKLFVDMAVYTVKPDKVREFMRLLRVKQSWISATA